jgi:hypothetical protein
MARAIARAILGPKKSRVDFIRSLHIYSTGTLIVKNKFKALTTLFKSAE